MIRPPVGYNYTAVSATTTIVKGTGTLGGILVSSATTGTIAVSDGGNTIMAASPSMTLSAPQFIELPATFSTDLTVTITGTLAATVLWVQ